MKHLTFVNIIFILFFVSCKFEEDVFSTLDKRIQNDGYLPLAQNNFWQYNTFKATKQSNNLYSYTDEKVISEQYVTNTLEFLDGLNSSARFDYKLSPIDVGSFLGSFIGLFNQVSKQNGEYKSKQVIRIKSNNFNGSEKNILSFELEDQPFLVDNPFVGQILSQKEGSLKSPDNAIIIEYKKITKIIDILPKIPSQLSNIIGIDDHLSKYDNIVHIVDSILIKKVTLTEKAENTIVLNAKGILLPGVKDIDTPGGRTIININQGGSTLTATLTLPIFGGVQLASIKADDLNLIAKAIVINCEVQGDININTTLKGGEINLISNSTTQNNLIPFMSIDNYWAKGVGKIKSITKTYDLPLTININDYLQSDTFPIQMKRVDPECAEFEYGKEGIALEPMLQLRLSQPLSIELPVGGSEFIYVQNLINKTIRKSLN